MKRGLLALPLALGACVAVVSAPPPGPAPGGPHRPGWIVPGPSCDRTDFDAARIIGRRPEDLGIERFPFPVRVITPGMAVTMDYSPARLNLEVNERGYIHRYRCG